MNIYVPAFDQLDNDIKIWGDKNKDVRENAKINYNILLNDTYIIPTLIYKFLPIIKDQTIHWQVRYECLISIQQIVEKYPTQVTNLIPEIIPVFSSMLTDPREQIKTMTNELLIKLCKCAANKDIEAFIPDIVASMSSVDVSECIHKLGATTFVQEVKEPVLAILVPLLLRGLRDRSTPVKRKSAVIIDNMSKLVDDPNDAKSFLPKLMPELQKCSENVANPECREMMSKAHNTLQKINDALKTTVKRSTKKITFEDVKNILDVNTPLYYFWIAMNLTNMQERNLDVWKSYFGNQSETLYENCFSLVSNVQVETLQDNDPLSDLCNCEFSLAYGAKILLNNAKLHLKKNRRYGLCGPNGVGKSTLLKAIADGQVDGFPPKTQVKTVYVSHDLDHSVLEVTPVEYILNDPIVCTDVETTNNTLSKMGFSDAMKKAPVSSLSGGWKMKLALARAVLIGADILLLDEPTNHLDFHNVSWLVTYLSSVSSATCIIVSHDSSFLDNVCTDIIHYANRKLAIYRGNLSAFVQIYPDAQSYYDLSSSQISFKFPEPGFLEGVKTKDRAILKMENMTFKYETRDNPTLHKVTLYCTLNSRVACKGVNGAGKSTLIKVLTGELEASAGSVWKHPNLRVAYVAQHAFHHIEKHLTKTPVEYIQWRFAPGEDREALEKVTVQLTSDDWESLAAKIVSPDGTKRQIEKLLRRRKLKKDYEYEVQWVGLNESNTSWLSRRELESLGLVKLVNEIDAKEAAAMGLYSRPLTTLNVQKHLLDLGLDSEVSTHSRIVGLSGGQKVKLVLGAATWQQPHMIVLDEPTNYLDRDSLGALSVAIKEFDGGIIIVSHHKEFTDNVCTEEWLVENGQVKVIRQNENQSKEKIDFKKEEEITDAFGNVVKIKAPKATSLSNKEKKRLQKLKAARRERGEDVSEDDDDI
jgi:elongation factor 3